ncbi:hypothetical protein GIV23_26600 [Pseudomonas sp. PA-1-2A]|uniref:hypothetical protein n=1 Tax=Pseudomonas TaxID=286 RepID=UPI001CA6D2A1|nr:hypothetical protein [Pseudomonas carnis]MCF5691760.1 hypothetical protein [Pseudomonas sp. PA-1-8C]MCF5789582.1 hypothetical protein [Pseudomonas sp. PA-1-6G]MCF5792271.1 hypothetical protein [Pseudomonas sp. PA-1-6B]MCF5798795.1 hypothetical protein [Pseudomonas sp. PA-1-5A]MCF5816877.1 hypothetical protein [Pseudomonas sp. PA-1-2A]MCF5835265.1 hypothetical protein [Pseudomonas sp. PA-1-6A]
MPKQQACIASIYDFRRRFRPNIPELEPADLCGKRRISLLNCFLASHRARLAPAQAQHSLRHPLPMLLMPETGYEPEHEGRADVQRYISRYNITKPHSYNDYRSPVVRERLAA